MPTLCAVYGCGNNATRDSEKGFYRIPKVIRNGDPDKHAERLSSSRRRLWFAKINRADLTEEKTKYTRVCGDHFISGKPAGLYDTTNPDWVPSLKMGYDDNKDKVEKAVERDQRAKARQEKMKQQEAAEAIISLMNAVLDENKDAGCSVENIPQPEILSKDVECQTDMSGLQIAEMEQCVANMTTEIVELKKKLLDTEMSEESFKSDEKKTKFYTGLPNFIVLMEVMKMCSPFITSSYTNALTKFQELILVLMRLRLNIPLEDLAFRFKISRTTASRIFTKWIDVMSVRLKFLIVWPERQELRRTMPNAFKQNFGDRVAVIIDCFEVFINRPSTLMARAITWSNYKHHNTVKFLIGVTPQGVISFISKAWGGRVSDKHLTENCGILQKLLPRDIVLADRGFDIEASVGLYQASLKIPAFTRGKKQLSASEIENTRKIANVRIHVERVIGLVRRKYVILQSILVIDHLIVKNGDTEAPVDKIATVCCALTNLSDSIVPFE